VSCDGRNHARFIVTVSAATRPNEAATGCHPIQRCAATITPAGRLRVAGFVVVGDAMRWRNAAGAPW
jgi:hypothetical protein